MSILLDFLFPCSCFGCGCSGVYLCPVCRSKLKLHSVQSESPPFEGKLSLFSYHPPLSSIIKALKFSFVTDLIPTLAHLAADSLISNYPNLVNYWQQKHFVLIPVPLHHRRLNWRGFNQSQLVAKTLADLLNLQFIPSLLVRHRFSQPQSTLTSSSVLRLSNVSSSFSLSQPPPSSVIIFDDVTTTGSTLTAVASVFSPSTHIWALTLASKF